MAYATPSQLKARIGVDDTEDDAIYLATLDAATQQINRDTGRTFGQDTATVLLTPSNYFELAIPGRNLIAVTTLKTDDNNDGTFETTWSAADYELTTSYAGPETSPYDTIRAVGSKSFPIPAWGGRRNLVQIVGSWGWPSATPPAIVQACLLLGARYGLRGQAVFGVQSFGELGAVSIRNDVDYQNLIRPYKRVLAR